MTNIFREWLDLTEAERTQIYLTLCLVLASTVIVLYAMLVSRGQDVEYFKQRLGFMEQRMNNMDVKTDNMIQRQSDVTQRLNDMANAMEEIRRNQEQVVQELEALKKRSAPPAPRRSHWDPRQSIYLDNSPT